MKLGHNRARRMSRAALVLAAVSALLLPVAVLAGSGTGFDDVDDDSTFAADIAWLADAGITKGCNPPDNTLYCPKDDVTREQMSAFMHRLANNRVVDAGTVEGFTAAELMGQTGPQGPAGTDGAAGADGDDGADGAAGADGNDGADGAAGADGNDGADGADGVTSFYTNTDSATDSGTLFSPTTVNVSADCDAGDVLTGGGFKVEDAGWVTNSSPSGSGWVVSANVSGTDTTVTAYVICADVTP